MTETLEITLTGEGTRQDFLDTLQARAGEWLGGHVCEPDVLLVKPERLTLGNEVVEWEVTGIWSF